MIKTQKKEMLQLSKMFNFHKWDTTCLKDIFMLLALFPPSTNVFQDHAFGGERHANCQKYLRSHRISNFL